MLTLVLAIQVNYPIDLSEKKEKLSIIFRLLSQVKLCQWNGLEK